MELIILDFGKLLSTKNLSGNLTIEIFNEPSINRKLSGRFGLIKVILINNARNKRVHKISLKHPQTFRKMIKT